jgi:hypothetical protein
MPHTGWRLLGGGGRHHLTESLVWVWLVPPAETTRQKKVLPLRGFAWDALTRGDWRQFAMKRIGIALMGLLFLGHAAAASPTWSAIGVTTTPQNAPQVIAATDKLMSSAAGQEFPGRLLLQVHVADGNNPATHSFAPLYKSAADREAFVEKLQGDPAWADFQATMARISQPVGQVIFRTLKSWGEVVDTDHLWMSYSFAVGDPAALLAELEKFMASETGKKFPGQVHLAVVVAGGINPVSHTINVGYASEAEMETWGDSLVGNADWAAYLEASGPSAQLLGASMIRDVKAWGSVSLKDLSVP